MSKRNLILTILHGYDYPFVEPFFKSLKMVGYNGELVVFISEKVSKATKTKIKAHGAKVVEYKAEYPFIESYRTAFGGISGSITINNYRFVLYQTYLEERLDEYAQVMLTDIRDVIFQRTPFSVPVTEGISFFLEDPSHTFRHKLNYQWLTQATSKSLADKLLDKVVCCAGITIGSTGEILDYLQYIKGKLSQCEKLEWGLDQGIHNSYVYEIKPVTMRIFGSDEPYVINLGAYQPYSLNKDGELVNSLNQPYAIVHQYDRSGGLFASIKERYIGSRLMQKIKRIYYLIMP
ncbi:MAG: hypothetical protein JWR09_956 [Mucilaginibacter sp.]|nr:hypothetical protein [Mucilaginibacter sp.]